MDFEITVLMITAASIGFVHTGLGPDHYIPFIALSEPEKCSNIKTSVITLISGSGNLLSSILIGIVVYFIGSSLFSLGSIVAFRGDLAGWLLIAFGLIYSLWGIRQSFLNRTHSDIHAHDVGTVHTHNHDHSSDHVYVHVSETKNLMAWLIFIIFILGPCGLLISLLIYPAASHNFMAMIAVSDVFTIATLSTILIMVFVGIHGLLFFPVEKVQKHIHALAGISNLFAGLVFSFWVFDKLVCA